MSNRVNRTLLLGTAVSPAKAYELNIVQGLYNSVHELEAEIKDYKVKFSDLANYRHNLKQAKIAFFSDLINMLKVPEYHNFVSISDLVKQNEVYDLKQIKKEQSYAKAKM